MEPRTLSSKLKPYSLNPKPRTLKAKNISLKPEALNPKQALAQAMNFVHLCMGDKGKVGAVGTCS